MSPLLDFLTLLIVPELIQVLAFVITVSLIAIILIGTLLIGAKLANKLANEINKARNG